MALGNTQKTAASPGTITVAHLFTFKKESPMANEPKKREPDIPPKQPDIQLPKQPDIQPEPRPEEIPQDKDVPQKENPPMQL